MHLRNALAVGIEPTFRPRFCESNFKSNQNHTCPHVKMKQAAWVVALFHLSQLSPYARVALAYSRFGRGQKQSHVALALYLLRGQTSYSSKGRRKKHYMVGSNAVEEVLASLLSVPSGSRDLSLSLSRSMVKKKSLINSDRGRSMKHRSRNITATTWLK